MAAATVIVTVGGVFAVLGALTGRELATRDYRIPDDVPTGLPRGTWWTGPLAGLLAGYLAWRIGGLAQWAALPAYLLLAWLAVPLIWIDRARPRSQPDPSPSPHAARSATRSSRRRHTRLRGGQG